MNIYKRKTLIMDQKDVYVSFCLKGNFKNIFLGAFVQLWNNNFPYISIRVFIAILVFPDREAIQKNIIVRAGHSDLDVFLFG